MGVSECNVETILYDTYNGFKITCNHPMMRNILDLLDKAGVSDEYATPIFDKNNLLENIF